MKPPTVRERRRDLKIVARMVFLDRNAQGMPAKDRLELKARARPDLRQAIYWLRESRNALRAGDLDRQLLLRDRAMMHLAFGLIKFYSYYAIALGERYDALTKFSGKGGAATKLDLPELERQIKACLKRRSDPSLHEGVGR